MAKKKKTLKEIMKREMLRSKLRRGKVKGLFKKKTDFTGIKFMTKNKKKSFLEKLIPGRTVQLKGPKEKKKKSFLEKLIPGRSIKLKLKRKIKPKRKKTRFV